MPYYVASYDTEAIYPWWELGDKQYSAQLYQESVSYRGKLLKKCLEGIQAVAEVHIEHNAPASFFLVAKLVESASSELRRILDHPLFDIQCHSYTHANLTELNNNEEALKKEIFDSKHIIEDSFGRKVIGFTTPGAFTDGLVGRKLQLQYLWNAGYRFIRSVGKGPFDTVPAPLTQPFWYVQDGFADMLELGLHAWHDTVLTGQPFVTHWPPVLPWGFPSKVPETPKDVYEAYAPGIDYIVENNFLTYVPCFHPWAVYRVDKKAFHIGLLLTHAKRKTELVSCSTIYKTIKHKRSLAADKPNIYLYSYQ